MPISCVNFFLDLLFITLMHTFTSLLTSFVNEFLQDDNELGFLFKKVDTPKNNEILLL